MQEFRTQVKAGGRIIIPGPCRKALKLKEGDEVIIHLTDNQEATIYSLAHAIEKAQSLLKATLPKNVNLSEELIEMRRSEAKDD